MTIISSFTRHLLAVGLLASVPVASMAQGPAFGIKGGLNMSNLYSGEVDDNNMRLGFNLGVFGRSDIEKPLGFQVELLYSTKGNTTNYSAFGGLIDQEVDFALNYLEVPVMASIRIGEGALELQAGGYVGYLLSSTVSSNGDLGSSSDELAKDNFTSMDAGLVAGAAFNAGALQFGARYAYGLSPIANSDEADFLLGDAKNSCIQLFVGLAITGKAD